MKDSTSPSFVIDVLSYSVFGLVVPMMALRLMSFYNVSDILLSYGFVGKGNW